MEKSTKVSKQEKGCQVRLNELEKGQSKTMYCVLIVAFLLGICLIILALALDYQNNKLCGMIQVLNTRVVYLEKRLKRAERVQKKDHSKQMKMFAFMKDTTDTQIYLLQNVVENARSILNLKIRQNRISHKLKIWN